MVDTIKCQTEADLTELFFKKLLLGAIDKSLDHEETIATPSSYKYSHYPSQTATASYERPQDEGNPNANTWVMDQRPAESSHQVGQPYPAPKAASLLHRQYTTPNFSQPPQFRAEQNFRQSPELQHFPERPAPHRPIRQSTMPPDHTEEQPSHTNFPGKSPRHRG